MSQRGGTGTNKPVRVPLKPMSDRRAARLQSEGRLQHGSTFATASAVLSPGGAFSNCGRHYDADRAEIAAGARNAKGASPRWEAVECWREGDFHVVRCGSEQAKKFKPGKDGGFSPAVKLAVRARAGNGDPDSAMAECCGTWLGRYGGDIQHVVARQSGGSHLVNKVYLAVLMCRPCHDVAEKRDEHSRAQGFWRRSTDEPSPVMIHGNGGGMTFWLTATGAYSTERPEWAGQPGQTLRELLGIGGSS